MPSIYLQNKNLKGEIDKYRSLQISVLLLVIGEQVAEASVEIGALKSPVGFIN